MSVEQIVNHQLELRVIGTAFANRTAAEAYVQDHRLTVDHFTVDAHRTLWGVVVHRLDTDGQLDDIVLNDVLQRHPDLIVGGVDRGHVMTVLATALGDCDPTANVEHAQLLRDLAERRRLVRAVELARQSLAQPQATVTDTVTALTEAITNGSLARRGPQIRSARSAIEEALTSQRWEDNQQRAGLTLGFRGLDRVMSLRAGTVTVVAARPSIGKSLFVQQVISHVVHHHQARALLFSLEMEEDELIDRLAAHEADVPGRWLSKDRKRQGEHGDRWSRLLALGNDTALDRYEFVDDVDLSVSDVVTLARRHKAKQPDLQLVVVDYIGLLRYTDPRQLPVHAIAEISRQLKVLAINQKVAVVVLSQLNRGSENDNRRPRLRDLRDSGAVEQDADHVLFLHADTGPPGLVADHPTAATEVIVAKNRSGQRGVTVPIDFDGTIPRFVDRGPNPPATPSTSVPYPDVPLPNAA